MKATPDSDGFGHTPLSRRQFLSGATALVAGGGALAASGTALARGQSGRSLVRTRGASTTISVRYWAGKGAETTAWTQRIAYFKQLYPDVNVDVQFLALNGYQEFPALLAEFAAGNAPDVIRVLNYQPTQLVKQGNKLLPLDPFIKASKTLDPSDFTATAWRAGQVAGVQYAIPQNGEPYSVFYNTTAFKKAGIPTPDQLLKQGKWDQDHVLSSAQALVKSGGVKYGVAWESWNYDNIAFMGGGAILNADGQPVIDKSPTPEIYQWFADLVNVHKVAPTPEVNVGTNAGYFTNGQIGIIIVGHFYDNYFATTIGKNFEFGETIMPTINGHIGCKLELDALSITKDSKNPQTAWDFVQTVTDKHAETLWIPAATPSRLSVLNGAVYRKYSYAPVVFEMLKYSTFTPFTAAGAAVDTDCTTALSPMWLGKSTAAQATANAAAALHKTLA